MSVRDVERPFTRRQSSDNIRDLILGTDFSKVTIVANSLARGKMFLGI